MKRFILYLAILLFPGFLYAQYEPELDVRGQSPDTDGGEFQLANEDVSHTLRFFSGRSLDPKPFLYFSMDDTFRIASGQLDDAFSGFAERMTFSPNTFIGINNPWPIFDLDIRSSGVDDGSELNLGNSDNSHFLRFFSGKQTQFPYPIISWKPGDSLSLGVDSGTYKEILRLRTDGTMFLNSKKGIALNKGEKPMITIGDTFMSGPYSGIGKWGLFMEPDYLTMGVPSDRDVGFQFVYYKSDGSINDTPLRIKNGLIGLNNLDPQYLLDINGSVNFTSKILLNDSSGVAGQVLTSNGNADPTWNTVNENPQIGFKAQLAGDIIVPPYVDTTVTSFNQHFDDGNNFDPVTGIFTVPENGLYHFDILFRWDNPGAVLNGFSVFIRIKINGANYEQTEKIMDLQMGDDNDHFYSCNFKLTAGDEVSFGALQDSGSDLTLYANGFIGDTKISGYKIY